MGAHAAIAVLRKALPMACPGRPAAARCSSPLPLPAAPRRHRRRRIHAPARGHRAGPCVWGGAGCVCAPPTSLISARPAAASQAPPDPNHTPWAPGYVPRARLACEESIGCAVEDIHVLRLHQQHVVAQRKQRVGVHAARPLQREAAAVQLQVHVAAQQRAQVLFQHPAGLRRRRLVLWGGGGGARTKTEPWRIMPARQAGQGGGGGGRAGERGRSQAGCPASA